ncbi:hypothetical protein PYCCODRAFT_923908 [Trametes coccinea BRFM310]|uniref:Uncharacterized protein n=1 Tax=Trametes coccinea (strain BRFM310) TaxID=1353009 RepID=A0A1Y2J0C5_TRAC3|nr:hypothetical protein PYCCODRAFT_923908 [Trametes coccinea BRFM310]
MRSGSPFIPMRFDSSPQSDIARSYHTGRGHGTPEYLRDTETVFAERYEPTRVPFYSDDTSRTSSGIQGASVQAYGRLSDSCESLLVKNESASPACKDSEDIRSSSVPRLCLPPALVESQPMLEPPYQIARTASEVSSLPPSASSRLSWGGSGSHPLDSDVPQASFSLSPPLHSLYSHYQVGDEDPSESGDAGPLSACGSFDTDPEAPAGHPHISIDSSLDLWEQSTLAEVLRGALFDDADPWCALDDVLCLRSLPSEDEAFSDSRLESNGRNPTCGVGYVDHERCGNRLTIHYPSLSDTARTVYGDPETTERSLTLTRLCYDMPSKRGPSESSAERGDLCGTTVGCSPSNSTDGSYPASGSDVATLRISTPGQDPCFVQASVSAWDLDQQMLLDSVNTPVKVETVETTASLTRIVMSCAELTSSPDQTSQAEEAATGNVPCDNSVDAAGGDRNVWTGAASLDDQLVDGPSLFSDGDSVGSEEDG